MRVPKQMKESLQDKVSISLLKAGYSIKQMKGCCDVIARKNETILLVKVLEDTNSMTKEHAEEMKKIASMIQASPLIIAEKGGHTLEDNVVYARLGMHAINLPTLLNALHQHIPFIKSNRSGLTVEIKGKTLQQKREEENISLHALSRKMGVSSRMIVKYENESAEISFERALKVYELFGADVFTPINLFSFPTDTMIYTVSSDVGKKFNGMGFSTLETRKLPIDLIAKKESELIITGIGDHVPLDIMNISTLIDADKLIIFNKKKPKEQPAISKEEFFDLKDAHELIKFLRECA